MNRREMILKTAAATAGLALSGCVTQSKHANVAKKVLFFSKSSGFEHPIIKRNGTEPSFAEKILAELGPKHGVEFTFSKDGSLFTPEYLAGYDAYFFFTSGDLTAQGADKNPAMTPAGKAAFLEAIHGGKGFIGTHSATDTFLTNEPDGTDTKDISRRYHNYGKDADPYIRMIGAEFIMHDKQQFAKNRVVDASFPGMTQEDFSLIEEWYSFSDFSDDLHVLLAQETAGMTGSFYQRPSYPATWARMHGKGRVFYTSMGHREDVWTNSVFQQILFGGIAWALHRVNADVTPNIKKTTPGYATLPPQK